MKNGFTIWSRQTIESEIFFWKPDKWFKIWFYIVSRVNHKDTKLFKRGSAYLEYKEISLKTKATLGEIQSFLRWAKLVQMISTQKSTRGNVIIVLNYAKYQDWENYKIQAPAELQSKHNPSTIHAIVETLKDDKDDKRNSLFKTFWGAYPKKQDKKKAMIAFEKIKDLDIDKMIKALEAQKKSEQWTKDSGAYVPHPTTWLNGERWNDETIAKEKPITEVILDFVGASTGKVDETRLNYKGYPMYLIYTDINDFGGEQENLYQKETIKFLNDIETLNYIKQNPL